MIYTITLNPSVDYVVELKEFALGSLNKIDHDSKFPGGKGINVSRVLHRLGIPSKALGFVGGFTGRYIEESLTKIGVQSDFVQVQGDTRINIKLKTETETEINGQGPEIRQEELDGLMQRIERLTAEDILIMAGSIPKSVPVSIYETIAGICAKKGTKAVIDTSGDNLLKVLPNRPFLIKPNHHELGELFDAEIETVEDAMPYGRQLVDKGAQHVIVSLAGMGALLFSKELSLYANVPVGTVVNSVGAGDSVVAGFVASYVQTGDVRKSFEFGVASGSATAFSLDLCTRKDVERLLPQIKTVDI